MMKIVKVCAAFFLALQVSCSAYSDKLTPVIEKMINQKTVDTRDLKSIDSLDDLQKLRNSMYAYYGYKFKNQELTAYFQKYKWYKPQYGNVESKLTAMDKSSIECILYAEIKLKREALMRRPNSDFASALSENEKQLVGIWQSFPHMASGWNVTYAFYPARNVIYRTSQMDGETRLLAKIGHWKIIGSKLHIEYCAKEIREGGTMVPAYASYASDFVLEGAVPVLVELKPVEVEEFEISKIDKDIDPDSNHYMMVLFDGSRKWRLRENPEDY